MSRKVRVPHVSSTPKIRESMMAPIVTAIMVRKIADTDAMRTSQ